MAWPSTPLTTYVANFTPAIKAFDLNSFQSAINGIVNGTYNLAGVTLTTGTAGSVVSPSAGSLIAARSVFDAGIPTAATLAAGEHCRETPPAALASLVGTGTTVTAKSGYGLYAKSRLALGQYTVTLQRVPTGPSANNVVALVSGIGDVFASASLSLDGSNRPVVSVKLYAVAAGSPASITAVDSDFFLAAWVF